MTSKPESERLCCQLWLWKTISGNRTEDYQSITTEAGTKIVFPNAKENKPHTKYIW